MTVRNRARSARWQRPEKGTRARYRADPTRSPDDRQRQDREQTFLETSTRRADELAAKPRLYTDLAFSFAEPRVGGW